MKIELKKIKVFERMSEETTCFAADIYINGINAGVAINQGHGGPTEYSASNKVGNDLITEAINYCKALPPEEFTADGKEYSLPMNLELFIDNLLEKYLVERDLLKYRKRVEKMMEKSIVYGLPDQECAEMIFNKPITVLLAQTKGIEFLKATIVEKVIPKLNNGYMVLNTNIPEDILKATGLKDSQYVKTDQTLNKKKAIIKKQGKKGSGHKP